MADKDKDPKPAKITHLTTITNAVFESAEKLKSLGVTPKEALDAAVALAIAGK